ncbi:hypothetical protein [uncultured Psychroserpens sp.]|uniref:hypothetical protein n=1 Tax=uncultured Psychroserpens sp. TaxID=255436 RepID=UPI002602FAFC|nr:hypothetical protein [uncultured Psychroserpens sp.]
MKTINTINGIALHYARLPQHPYGTIGKQQDFKVENEFLEKLKTAFDEVFAHCPLGKPNVITSAGILVNKPGQHGLGKAFDLDAVFWDDFTLITNNFIHHKELYLGMESFLRKHFGIVLNHLYPNHADHWHFDTSVIVDYHESSQSETLYLQMVLRYIYGKSIIIDGVSGPQTRASTREVFERLNISTPITTKVNYLKFLDLTGKIAFKLSEDKVTPLQLLDNLETVVEGLPVTSKHAVSQALNSFLMHEDTSSWLNGITENHNLETIIDGVIG